MSVLWVFTVVLAGLNAGLLVSGLLEGRYLQQVPLSIFLQMHQPRDRLFRRLMPPLLLALMAGCLVLTALAATGTHRLTALIAFALTLADVLLTVRLMVPLNLQLGGYNALHPEPEGQMVRQRWSALHTLRTGLGVLAFLFLLLGV